MEASPCAYDKTDHSLALGSLLAKIQPILKLFFLNSGHSGSSCPRGRMDLFLIRARGDLKADQDLMVAVTLHCPLEKA